MKSIIAPAFAALLLAGTSANAQEGRFQQEALIIKSPSEFEQVWITDANKTHFLYYATERGVDTVKKLISGVGVIWLMEPPAYTEAMELYQGRKYEEARTKFAEVREAYKKLVTLPNNHSSLAAYWEMECLRKLNKLDDLKEVQDKFLPVDRESLTRPNQLQQMEIYTLWDAVRTKDWPRLEILCNEKLNEKMPGGQRAQVGYMLGLALEGQKKGIPAINAYNIGMTADTGASEVITAQSALNALRLYKEDELVQQAIRLHGTPDEDAQSSGALRLEEAASLAALFELTLGGGKALPAEYKELLKYLPKDS
jgi:hypothetical protein